MGMRGIIRAKERDKGVWLSELVSGFWSGVLVLKCTANLEGERG